MASLNDVLAGAEDEIELDLSGSVEYGDAPYGKYVAKLDHYELKDSKKGDPMIAWFFHVESVIELADPEDTEPEPGTFLPITHTMLTGAAAWRTRELYEALGGDMKAKNKQGKTSLSPKTVVGNLIRCVKQQQSDNPEYDELTGFEKNSGKSALA